jgi:murein DD-endopeptidase MepM/ murein hydrolase activator NlpD
MPPTKSLFLPVLLLPLLLCGCPSHRPVPPTNPPPKPLKHGSRFNYKAYTVRKGDTLISIGRRFGVPWQEIQRANDASPHDLRIGQILLIPLHARDGDVEEPTSPASPDKPPSSIPPSISTEGSIRKLSGGDPSARWWWPTTGHVSRHYKERFRGFPEPGVGIAAERGAQVHAVGSGRVICVIHRPSAAHRGWGNVVAIDHGGEMVSWYGFLDRIEVEEGDRVQKGQAIATVGTSGANHEPELALRFFRDERPINPLPHLPGHP